MSQWVKSEYNGIPLLIQTNNITVMYPNLGLVPNKIHWRSLNWEAEIANGQFGTAAVIASFLLDLTEFKGYKRFNQISEDLLVKKVVDMLFPEVEQHIIDSLKNWSLDQETVVFEPQHEFEDALRFAVSNVMAK